MHWPLEHVNCDELQYEDDEDDECEPAMRWRTSHNRHTHERQGWGMEAKTRFKPQQYATFARLCVRYMMICVGTVGW